MYICVISNGDTEAEIVAFEHEIDAYDYGAARGNPFYVADTAPIGHRDARKMIEAEASA